MITPQLMACVAGLLGLPPAPPPPVLVLPLATIQAVKSDRDRPGALFAAGLVIISRETTFSLLAHELAHATQARAGQRTNTPAAEAAAEFVQRHAATWCAP